MLKQSLMLPNAEKMCHEAERSVKEAKEKHSPKKLY